MKGMKGMPNVGKHNLHFGKVAYYNSTGGKLEMSQETTGCIDHAIYLKLKNNRDKSTKIVFVRVMSGLYAFANWKELTRIYESNKGFTIEEEDAMIEA